jgi:hypothetical protein
VCLEAKRVRDEAVVIGTTYWQAADNQCATVLLYGGKQSSRSVQGLNVTRCLIDCRCPIGIDFECKRKSVVVSIAESARASLAFKAKFFKVRERHCTGSFGLFGRRELVFGEVSPQDVVRA